MALKLDIEDYRIEQRIGYTENKTTDVDTYVLFNSSDPQEDLEQLFGLSLQMCFAGEALKNATEMETSLFLNGSLID